MVTIGQLFCLILSGVATAASIRISVFYGQNNYSAVIENAKDCFRLELIIATIIAIPVIIFRNQIGGCFTNNTEVQHMVSIVIFTLIAYQFGDGLQYTYANALRGIACVRPMVLYAFIAYFVISLPLGYLLGIHLKFDLVGIWTAFPISLSVAGIQYYLRFKKEMNLKIQ
jgi:MATE family multidrug resistance protein